MVGATSPRARLTRPLARAPGDLSFPLFCLFVRLAQRLGQVELKELTLEDRERVLRLLFAKINAVQGSVPQMPPHELHEETPATTPFMTQLPPQPPSPGEYSYSVSR